MRLRSRKITMLLKILTALGFIFSLCVFAIYVDSHGKRDFVADVGIVYGNKVELNGSPSSRLEARLLAALYLYKTNQIEKVLVSGGVGAEGYDEAKIMETYLVSNGIPSTDIQVDSKGNNTHLTALNAAAFLGQGVSVVAISQRYHLSRAKLSLRNAGFDLVYGFAPDFTELRDAYSYVREVPAWFKYWVKGL